MLSSGWGYNEAFYVDVFEGQVLATERVLACIFEQSTSLHRVQCGYVWCVKRVDNNMRLEKVFNCGDVMNDSQRENRINRLILCVSKTYRSLYLYGGDSRFVMYSSKKDSFGIL